MDVIELYTKGDDHERRRPLITAGGEYLPNKKPRYFECGTCGKECRADVVTECKRCGAHYKIGKDTRGRMLQLSEGVWRDDE